MEYKVLRIPCYLHVQDSARRGPSIGKKKKSLVSSFDVHGVDRNETCNLFLYMSGQYNHCL